MTANERRDVEAVIPAVRSMIARRFFGVPAWIDRADMLQAAMEAVCRARPRFDPEQGAVWKTYALHRAQGAVQDYLRSERPGTRRNPLPPALSIEFEVESDETSREFGDKIALEDLALRTFEIDHDLDQALADLPPDQASTLRRWLAGALLREIADADGVTLNAVNQRMIRARSNLSPFRDALAG